MYVVIFLKCIYLKFDIVILIINLVTYLNIDIIYKENLAYSTI